MPHAEDTSSTVREQKRRRTEADEDQPGLKEQWTHHPRLYLQDGLIVLLAGATLFRVYGGLLSMHSEVFRDMLSLSSHQPSDAEMYEGCPLVRLSDSPQDIESFLEAFMDINYFSEKNQAISFPIVSGILRIATKYMVPKLRAGAIAHLDRYIPMEMDEIKVKANLRKYREVFGVEQGQWPKLFEPITLFSQCNVPKFLPWAYYLACVAGYDALLARCTLSGGSPPLSPQDARVALRGLRALTDLDSQIRVELFSNAAPGCRTAACSGDSRFAMLKVSLRHYKPNGLVFNRPRVYSAHCASCIAHWATVERAGLEGVWDKLPSVFGLPPWQELLRPES